MRGYAGSESRWRDEDLDEYEEEDEEGYEDEGEEEEEEDPKPTKEEMDYLKMRERLKEQIRQKYRKENGAANGRLAPSADKKRVSANTEFGSFFGPSQPVIARRVIEESHSIRETQHITAKTPSSHSSNKRVMVANGERRTHAPKVVNELKSKVEALKDMRDYSFLLSDDAELPAPSKEPLQRNSSTFNSGTKNMTKPFRPLPGGHDLMKPVSTNQHAQYKPGFEKTTPVSSSRPSGSGPGRPPVQKPASTSGRQSIGSERSPVTAINKLSSDRQTSAVKPDSSTKKYYSEQRRENPGIPKATAAPRQATAAPRRATAAPRQATAAPRQTMAAPRQTMVAPRQPMAAARPPTSSSKFQHLKPQLTKPPQMKPQSSKTQQSNFSSKPQMSKPSNQILQRNTHEKSLKRKPPSRYSDEELEDDGKQAISMIRQMFRYNPNRYRDDDDDSDMEANFDDIMREERRSSKIARQEDEEQLRLIEEEEKRERMRKLAKKRKLA